MTRLLFLLSMAIAVTTLSSCVAPHHHGGHGRPGQTVVHRPGPPPHAPAHGYRHKHRHHDVELVFDSQIGVYVVVGWENLFYHRDHFYRVVDGAWQISVRPNRSWAPVQHRKLPKGLAGKAHKAKHQAKGKGKGKGKHGHPAKRRD